jgi:hypothetical protein
MMKFNKKSFSYSGGYLRYCGPEVAGEMFIARFKSGRKIGGTKSDFIRLLSKYYSIEDWAALAAVKAPLKILMDDGYIQFDPVNRCFLIAK